MEFISILYFFIVILGLGYALKRILNLKEFQDNIEEIIFLIGLGLSVFVLICIPLSLVKLLYWQIFLIIALVVPVYDIFLKIQNKENIIFKFSKKELKIYAILGLILLVFFTVYLRGAFAYPYLEDDDSFLHSIAAKYVAIEHTYVQPSLTPVDTLPNHLAINTLEPYPPFYSTLMGVLHQTNPKSIQWVLKFFNVLLISLGLLFAYIWIKKFANSDKIAIIAVFLLAVIPCFMSHFIWAQTLSLIIWFPALYSVEKLKEEKNRKWILATALIISTILITQVFSAGIFVIFFLLYIFIELIAGKADLIKSLFVAGFLSLIIALSLYWVPELIFRGWKNFGPAVGFIKEGNLFVKGSTIDTSAGKIYGIRDFMISPLANKIDQPTGIGIVIFALLILSIILFFYQIKKIPVGKYKYLIVSMVWLVVAVFGIEGNALPYKIFPHRFWVFLPIPISIITAFGIIWLYDFTKKNKLICCSIFLAIFVGIIITSGYPKYKFETAIWPPGAGWVSAAQIDGYLSLNKLPTNTLTYSLCKNPKTVIGFDKMDYPWVKEIEDYKNNALFDSLENNYSFLTKYNYSYLIVDAGCITQFGNKNIETINDKIKQINDSKIFEVVPQLSNNNFYLFKVITN